MSTTRPRCPNDGCQTLLCGRSYSVCITCSKKRMSGSKSKRKRLKKSPFSRHASSLAARRKRRKSLSVLPSAKRSEFYTNAQQTKSKLTLGAYWSRGLKSKGTFTSKTTKKANGTNKAKSEFPIQPHKRATMRGIRV
jgi:hypothetical protein